ncbi:MAG TPA: arginase family protein [Amycolatopsis sp.]|nr:arginase family protein [Amycolatopsis sp.]
MPIIFVPYHQDERLPAGSIPLPGIDRTVTAKLTGLDVWQRLSGLHGEVADVVAEEIRGGAAPAVVSGDCLVSLGVVAGVQRAGIDPSVIWFDAHGDLHTLESSASGYLGGLSLRLLLGAHHDRIAAKLGLRPLGERQAILVDARDLEPAEADYLAAAEVRHCGVDDVEVPAGPIVLHVDVDVIDCAELPGLGFPAPDGPSSAAVIASVKRILAEGDVVAVHIACPWNPVQGRDHENRARLLKQLLGA